MRLLDVMSELQSRMLANEDFEHSFVSAILKDELIAQVRDETSVKFDT